MIIIISWNINSVSKSNVLANIWLVIVSYQIQIIKKHFKSAEKINILEKKQFYYYLGWLEGSGMEILWVLWVDGVPGVDVSCAISLKSVERNVVDVNVIS